MAENLERAQVQQELGDEGLILELLNIKFAFDIEILVIVRSNFRMTARWLIEGNK